VKLASNASPLVARANAYITDHHDSDYTIRADVSAMRRGENMPDVGIGANRYTLMLDGNKQRLRIVSWDALPRVEKSIPWPWQPTIWYSLKLRVDLQEGKAIVRGKAWRRGETEPQSWTIEFTDPCPNREGSPLLYGYATGFIADQPGAEAYYDKVEILPNEK
jgi:hypothetical protein